MEGLENDADILTAKGGDRILAHGIECGSRHLHGTAVGPLETGENHE